MRDRRDFLAAGAADWMVLLACAVVAGMMVLARLLG